MLDGFVKAAAVTPDLKVADPVYNREQIVKDMREAAGKGAKIIVFPELAITGYTCGDLFSQRLLIDRACDELLETAEATADLDAIVFVGCPWLHRGKLYNVLAALSQGKILGMIPKQNLPNYAEFYERRNFTPGFADPDILYVTDDEGNEDEIPIGGNILFECEDYPDLLIGAEICEDLWSPNPPSTAHALAGATVLINASASNEAAGKASYRRNLVTGQSGRLIAGYIYTSSGIGESTTDIVFGGHRMIAENGVLLAEGARFENGITYSEIDVDKLIGERQRNTCFLPEEKESHMIVPFSLNVSETELTRTIRRNPFVPAGITERNERCEEILQIQSNGLAKRLRHIGCRNAVIGISGGLDSTLALLVTVKAFNQNRLLLEGIQAVTMPCFGTTDRTYNNACRMAESTGATLKEVPIREAVNQHFRDIGQDPDKHDVTYENCQARERTQVLMDLANQCGGIVVGTGDMSELALGWATYNGDHMSMYGVNAGVPKTLVRHLVRYYADTCGDEALRETLLDVLDTPVSPELLPPQEGQISQKTEDLVGPYELHDFVLYYMLRYGFPPRKIFRLAALAFRGEYDQDTILRWLKTFYRRFFAQQFKRSCLPDGPKVGSAAVSPRGDWRMPSDGCARIWLDQLDML